ncbi:MAG: DUF2336 domain-containing protein [Alphaproteobacteria bacterium]
MPTNTPYQRLLELAHARAIDGKGGLAASIAEMCLAAKADLGPREMALAFEILRMLVNQVEMHIRRQIADYLADRNDVPRDLLMFLANDEITVAYPILVHSHLLSDADLIQIAVKRSSRHRQAIAIRPELGAAVSDVLIATGEVDTITTLLCNKTASVQSETLERLVAMSLEIPAYREPLVHRSDLPTACARRLYMWVGEALQAYIADHFAIDEQAVRETVDHAIGLSLAGLADARRRSAGVEPDAPTKPDLALLRALADGNIREFEDRFAAILRLPQAAVKAILDNPGRQPLAVAGKGSGLERNTVAEIMCHLSRMQPPSRFAETEGFRRAMKYYDRIDRAGAEAVLATWRRTPNIEWIH